MGVGLTMIVKDEAPVIERCLRSVRSVVDWWVIADTGSSDDTRALVRAAMHGIPGVLLERPWVDFGHNRQETLDAARALPTSASDDHALWIDADEELVDPPASWPDLTADGHLLPVDYDGTRYARLAIVRLDRAWRWTGAIHEHLDLPGAGLVTLDAPTVLVRREGARSRDPDTYRRDAAVIDRELAKSPDDPRLQFYRAQSWRDAGEPGLALAAYRTRLANPAGWDQECWYAGFQVAAMLERLGRPTDEVVEAYLQAYDTDPGRAEPLVELARLERSRGRFAVAQLYAEPATRIPMPGLGSLFVDRGVYEWRSWDELAVSCYWTGRDDVGMPAAERALAARPDDARLQANLQFFRDRVRSR